MFVVIYGSYWGRVDNLFECMYVEIYKVRCEGIRVKIYLLFEFF